MEIDYIHQLSAQEKSFSSLYRTLAKNFGLSECGMWICYFLIVNNGDIIQQDLVKHLMFPKQTINSSVKKLVSEGYIRVMPLPTSRKSKKLALTEKGEKHTQITVRKLLEAEKMAMSRMGQDRMQQYIKLQETYLAIITDEFLKAKLIVGEKNDRTR